MITEYFKLLLLFTFAVLSVLLSLSFGAVQISFAETLSSLMSIFTNHSDSLSVQDNIILHLRIPRTLIALVAGGALALSGLVLQVITRNPLADPYLFGISAGASFGAVVSIAFAQSLFWLPLSLSAFVGSMLSMLLLILISRLNRYQNIETIVLSGVAVSFMFSALTSLLLYWSDPQAITSILFWSMGSFSNVSLDVIGLPLTLLIIVTLIITGLHGQLVAITMGDESAITVGVNVRTVRISMLILVSVLTASVVAIAGGIGFVGLMIPHIVRRFVNFGYKLNPLVTVVVGGIFMVWVDISCRVLLDNQELPVGVVTSAIGSAFFLTLLYFRSHPRNTVN